MNDPTKLTIDKVEQSIAEIGYKVVYEKMSLKVGSILDLSDSEKIEKNLGQMEGTKSVSVNFASSQINVEYNPALISTTDVRRRIYDIGYEILSETVGKTAQDIESKKLCNLFFIGIICTIPIIIFLYFFLQFDEIIITDRIQSYSSIYTTSGNDF